MLGNARFTRGEILTPCKSRRELTDTTKDAIDQSGNGGCPICAKMRVD